MRAGGEDDRIVGAGWCRRWVRRWWWTHHRRRRAQARHGRRSRGVAAPARDQWGQARTHRVDPGGVTASVSVRCRFVDGQILHRERHHGPRGPRAGPQAPGHVHRRHRRGRAPPPALGDRRQLGRRGDQRLRRRIEVTLHKDGEVGHRRPTTAAASRSTCTRKYKKPALEVILTTLHAGGKFEAGQLLSTRAACTASARRWSTRCPSKLIAQRPARRRRAGSRRSRAARRRRKLKKVGAGARHRHDDQLHARRRDLRRARSFDAEAIRERLEAEGYLHSGLKIVFHDESDASTRGHVPPRGRHRRRTSRRSSPRARQAAARRRGRSRSSASSEDGAADLELALAWTEATDEHVRSLRQRHPDARRRHARERASSAGIVKAVRNYIDDPQPGAPRA